MCTAVMMITSRGVQAHRNSQLDTDSSGWSGREVTTIKKVKGGYQVVSSKGRNRDGSHQTLGFAKKRLRQVEFSTTAKGKSGENPAGTEVRSVR